MNFPVFFVLRSAAASLLAVAFGSMPALAQPSGAVGDDFIYRIVKDDTLVELAQRYTDGPGNWSVLQNLNAVAEPTLLPIGLELRIPFSLIPVVPTQATVSHVAGQTAINGQPLGMGQTVAEGDTVSTGPAGYVTMALSDGSTLTVPASSSMRFDRLRAFRGTGLIDTIFTMREGSLESRVAPQDTGVGRFEIRTPVSITGVRGTRLRVHAQAQGSQSEVLEGAARLASGAGQTARLRPGQGAAIDAGGKMLGVRPLLPAPDLGNMARGGAGWVLSFPPVPGAAEYLVRVASDEAGTELHSSRRFATPDITFGAPGAGTYYVLVRAIDADGVMGRDAGLTFQGHTLLRSSDGMPIATAHGPHVRLTEY
ncbi:FecR domain-containing protein [Alcaligenaceae bacterium]|nr:FecR domain-containing protein [Alcaligenaceae bacterium]